MYILSVGANGMRVYWRFLFAALFAGLPLLSLPGAFHLDETRACVNAGFALAGFALGVFGEALKRSAKG
jgi:hypothetical protein